MSHTPTALVVGEALIDVVGADRLAGGSPMNVAVALSRLGGDVSLHTHIGTDDDGDVIVRHLTESGVRLTERSRDAARTSTARTVIGPDGAATYDFDVRWAPAPVQHGGFDIVHSGSISAVLAPGADIVLDAVAASDSLVSVDPNIRPALIDDRVSALRRLNALIGRADVVKASDEDVDWMYPGESPRRAIERWADAGVRLAVVTTGADGVIAAVDGTIIEVAAVPTVVVDTIGAGDTFMAALLYATTRDGLADPVAALAFAARCAAITVSRAGCNPPWAHELA